MVRVSLTGTLNARREAAELLETPQQALGYAALKTRLLGSALVPLGAAGWLLPLIMAILGGVLRFVRLGEPGSLVFDETYYVKDAYSLLQSGYEREWPENANDSFNASQPNILLDSPEYVVHPPVGKWMIAFGMALFGSDNGFGWRFGAALTGTLTILLLGLIAARLFSSAPLGALAGLFLAVDGHHLVHSRTSLLDVFLTFWVVAAFGALLLDRKDGRIRLARALSRRSSGADPAAARKALLYGPWLLWRPWRLAAGVCLGLAVGTKWSALAFVAVFGLMTVLWDVSARRVAGIVHWEAALLRDGVPAFLTVIPAAAGTYLATWTGWLQSSDAYDRQWAEQNPGEGWSWLPSPLRSLAEYHRSAYAFHNGLTSEHSYSSNAWTWLFMGRPTSFFYESSEAGENGCIGNCSTAVTSVGNPLIWWAAALALLVLLSYWIGRRDWRAGAVLSGVAAGYLPWFAYPERTTFFFYAVSFEPFLILALVYVLGLILGRSSDSVQRRRAGLLAVGCFVAAVLLASAFFLPVWTAETIPYSGWRLRMWMPSWI